MKKPTKDKWLRQYTERDDYQDDERDGDKHDRCLADVGGVM